MPKTLPAEFRAAMRRPANAVAVITTGAPGARTGLTMTAVCSLSDTPPSLLVCIYRESAALGPIQSNGCFGVNFLGAEHQNLAAVFAGRGQFRGEERFRDSDWTVLETGAPILASAVCAFDCRLMREIDSPTHAVLFGEVAAIAPNRPTARPEQAEALVYCAGTFGSFVPLAS